MFAWSSAGRLRPMRMEWIDADYHEPLYEIVKLERPGIRRWPRLQFKIKGSRVDSDRDMRRALPGATGRWPRNRKARPIRRNVL
jgi:hypothetical protein